MRFILSTLLFSVGSFAFAQNPNSVPTNKDSIRYIVDKAPEFPGGTSAMTKFIMGNLKFSTLPDGAEGCQKGFVKFVVNEDGKVSDVKTIRGFLNCPECDKELIKVVNLMPTWKPAEVKGKPVKSYFNLPIFIKLR